MSDSNIVGLDGRPINPDSTGLVDADGVPIDEEEQPQTMNPIEEIMRKERDAVERLSRKMGKETMSRHDTRQAIAALADLMECMKGYVMVCIHDMQAMMMQDRERDAYALMLEQRIVMLSELLVNKEVITNEELQKGWEELQSQFAEELKEEADEGETESV